MASLANPDQDPLSLEELTERLDADDYFEDDEVEEILADLEADGDATQSKNGWKNTKAGFEVLTGPIASDGGRAHGST
jgi:chromosome segregation and condensation protein ScpB